MLKPISFTPDKFGFYEVDGFKTYSKVDAIEVARKSNNFPAWNFNRQTFDAIDWLKEPELDLWSMYKLRAQQIRDEYDYVVLWYSGGSDSHNILCAWLDAGCKIDEIASSWNYDSTADKQNFQNAEISNVVLRDVETLKNKGHDFKFRLIDISQYSVDIVEKHGTNYEYFVNHYLSVNNPAKSLFRDKIQDYKDIIASGKKLCFVWGIEKPQIVMQNDQYHFRFLDLVDNCVNPYVQSKFVDGWYDELFYWTPDFPLLPVKQAHALKKFVTTCNDSWFYQDESTQFGINKTLNKYLTVEAAKTVIYPKWNNNIFCNGKAPSMIFSIRDKWFFDSNLEQNKKFKDIVKTTIGTLGTEWLVKNNVKCHTSPLYCIGK